MTKMMINLIIIAKHHFKNKQTTTKKQLNPTEVNNRAYLFALSKNVLCGSDCIGYDSNWNCLIATLPSGLQCLTASHSYYINLDSKHDQYQSIANWQTPQTNRHEHFGKYRIIPKRLILWFFVYHTALGQVGSGVLGIESQFSPIISVSN